MVDKNIQFKQKNGVGFDLLFPATKAIVVDVDGATLASILATTKVDLTTLKTDNTTNKSAITAIQGVNATQTTNISTLTTDNTANKTAITDIQVVNEVQTSDISTLKTDNTTNKANIATLTSKVTVLENVAWTNLTLINSFVPYSSTDKIQYKKKGNTVYLRGSLKGGLTKNPFVLPVEIRPDQTIRCPYLLSTGVAYVSIESNGTITLNDYTTGHTFASIDNISYAL